MAAGWGTLPGGLEEWACPKCLFRSPVHAWQEFGPVKRKCPTPSCDYAAFSTGDTDEMAAALPKSRLPAVYRPKKKKKANG